MAQVVPTIAISFDAVIVRLTMSRLANEDGTTVETHSGTNLELGSQPKLAHSEMDKESKEDSFLTEVVVSVGKVSWATLPAASIPPRNAVEIGASQDA